MDNTEVSQSSTEAVVPKSDPTTDTAAAVAATEPELVPSEASNSEPKISEPTPPLTATTTATASTVVSSDVDSSSDVSKERDLVELKVDNDEVQVLKSDADVDGSVEMNDLSGSVEAAKVSGGYVDVDMNAAADRQNVDSDVVPSSSETHDGRKSTIQKSIITS